MTRMLLPLSGHHLDPRPQQQGGDAREQQASVCALALAVLAAFCRLPDLAADERVVDKAPLLLKVWQGACLCCAGAGMSCSTL